MTQARYLSKTWLRQNASILLPLLAFAIPLTVRAVPEILMGQYLVGFDPIGYYVPNTLTGLRDGIDFWSLLSSAPLMYALLISVTAAGAPIVVTLKILGPLILGLLGVATYFYANKALSWSPIKSLVAAILSTLYFVALRISWDMFRSELALIFMFIALIFLQKKEIKFKNGVLLSLAMVLVVLTHQLLAIVMFAITFTMLAVLLFRKRKSQFRKISACTFPSALIFSSSIYLTYFVFSLPLAGYSADFAGGFESLASAPHLTFVADTFGFLALCYLPLVPLLVFGARKFRDNTQLNAWIAWLFIPLLLTALTPYNLFIGGVLPFRWILLLTYPLSFYAVEGLFAIRWNWYKIAYKIALGSIIAFLSVSFLVLPNSEAISYFTIYTSYIPKSMLQNTLQLSDCQDTQNALLWARNNLPADSYLLTHIAFYGWATLTIDTNRLVFYEYRDPLATAAQNANSSNSVYLIWWINGTGWYGQPTVPANFSEVYHSGNIAIFKYT